MKIADMYYVTKDYIPFYLIPIDHIFQAFIQWHTGNAVQLAGSGPEGLFLNQFKKVDDHSASRSTHWSNNKATTFVTMDYKELVLDITSETFEINS